MNVRVITRSAVSTSLRMVRMPLDAAINVLPGDGTRAKLAVDRADAAARSFAGAVTGDPELREDARRRRVAANERQQAVNLRDKADQTTEESHLRAEKRSEQAQQRRQEADRRAASRRKQADQEAASKRARAASAEKQRKTASRNVKRSVEARIEETAPEKRLEALEERAEAQQERQEALTASDEARRLGEAAAAVKEERKEA
jgi:hypothetical protein